MKRLKYLLLLLIVLVACGSLPVYGETDAPAPSLEAGQPVGGVVEITDGGATLRADASSGKIWVTDPFGGEWASNPDDPEADPVASGFLKMNLYAQLIVSYIGDNGAADTTNNRMELTAVIEALDILKEPCVVELYSDSKYVIDGLSKGWAKGWQKRGWIKSDKKPALNPDLWERLLALTDRHEMRYHWVKGHAENEKNNRCDQMAVAESKKFA